MNDEIHKLGEEIKKELTKLFMGRAFEPIRELIRQRSEAFRKEKIQFHINLDAVVTSTKEPETATLTKFPLARLVTGTTYPSDVREDPEEEKTLKKWEQGWSAARYSISFSEMPSYAKKNVEVCAHCNGAGIKIKP
ncbi:MAG: hypothetical protein M0D55_16095 [Elusimicrobiota bacterium]|nr:MAG: hypothetical protein M0D55_16095 [Elusimicrobiota bacterium]